MSDRIPQGRRGGPGVAAGGSSDPITLREGSEGLERQYDGLSFWARIGIVAALTIGSTGLFVVATRWAPTCECPTAEVQAEE